MAKAVGHAISDETHTVGQRADRTRQADRLLAGQAAPPGEVPRYQRQRRSQRGRLRDLHARARAGHAGRIPEARTRRRRSSSTPTAHPSHITPIPRPRLTARDRPVPDALQRRERSGQSSPRRSLPGALPALQTGPAERRRRAPTRCTDEHGTPTPRLRDRLASERDRRLLRLRGQPTGWTRRCSPIPANGVRRARLQSSTTAPTSTSSGGARTCSTGSPTPCSRTSPTRRCGGRQIRPEPALSAGGRSFRVRARRGSG